MRHCNFVLTDYLVEDPLSPQATTVSVYIRAESNETGLLCIDGLSC